MKNTREEFLEQLKSIVCVGDRYGKPENSFEDIAKLWSIYLDKDITEKDVCMLMCLLKVVRMKKNPKHLDSLVDIAGYSCSAVQQQDIFCRLPHGPDVHHR